MLFHHDLILSVKTRKRVWEYLTCLLYQSIFSLQLKAMLIRRRYEVCERRWKFTYL